MPTVKAWGSGVDKRGGGSVEGNMRLIRDYKKYFRTACKNNNNELSRKKAVAQAERGVINKINK